MTLNTPTHNDASATLNEAVPLLETLEIHDFSYAESALEDRSAPRTKLKIPASLRPAGNVGFHVTVHDMSLSGFAAEAFTCQPIGTRVWLTIPGLAPLSAEIARNDGTTVGCSFTSLLNQAVFDNLVARYRLEE